MKSTTYDSTSFNQCDIVLASGSERRAALLKEAGLTFRAHPVDVDEHIDEQLADDPVRRQSILQKRKPRLLLSNWLPKTTEVFWL